MIRRPGAVLALLTGLNLLNYLDRLVVSAVSCRSCRKSSDSRTSRAVSSRPSSSSATSSRHRSSGRSAIVSPQRAHRRRRLHLEPQRRSPPALPVGLCRSLLARAVVGVGEASYATLAPTIIDDVTPPSEGPRARHLLHRDAGRLRARLSRRRLRREPLGLAERLLRRRRPRALLALGLPPHRGARAQARHREGRTSSRGHAKLASRPLSPGRPRLLRVHRGDRRVLVLGAEVPLQLYASRRSPPRTSASALITVVAGAHRNASSADWCRPTVAGPAYAEGDRACRPFSGSARSAARSAAARRGGVSLADPEPLLRSRLLRDRVPFPEHLADQRGRASGRPFGAPRRARWRSASSRSIVFGDLWSPPLSGCSPTTSDPAGDDDAPVAIDASAFLWWPRGLTKRRLDHAEACARSSARRGAARMPAR